MKRIVYEHNSYPHIIATIEFKPSGDTTLLNWHMLFDSGEDFIKVVKTYEADVGQQQNVEKLSAYFAD